MVEKVVQKKKSKPLHAFITEKKEKKHQRRRQKEKGRKRRRQEAGGDHLWQPSDLDEEEEEEKKKKKRLGRSTNETKFLEFRSWCSVRLNTGKQGKASRQTFRQTGRQADPLPSTGTV